MERMKQNIKYVSIGMYKQLEEENKTLKEKVETLELWLDNKEKLNEEYRKEIDKLKLDGDECYQAMIFENDEVGYWKRECKKLKEDNKRLREGVDAGQKLVEDLISKNKKLKEELSKYKEQYQHSMGFSDFGGYDGDEHIVKDENTYRDLDL